jgi:uncharacterized protein YeaO (DUF488 family)
MKIWTTYFANIKNLDTSKILPVAICGKSVPGWSWPEYKKLAPSWSIYDEYKNKGGTLERYTERFWEERLSVLDREQVLGDLENLAQGYQEIALVCYEKPDDFCHRHIVAAWIGPEITEL